jgi:hypothetical protein
MTAIRLVTSLLQNRPIACPWSKQHIRQITFTANYFPLLAQGAIVLQRLLSLSVACFSLFPFAPVARIVPDVIASSHRHNRSHNTCTGSLSQAGLQQLRLWLAVELCVPPTSFIPAGKADQRQQNQQN